VLAVLPPWLHRILAPLRGCLLEIYLIHGAIFVHPTGSLWVDFVVTMVLVLVVAKALETLRLRLSLRAITVRAV